ncbi:hypothetical protein LINGRAHAP2_LOCUS2570, partial [Linum grandiflorum]
MKIGSEVSATRSEDQRRSGSWRKNVQSSKISESSTDSRRFEARVLREIQGRYYYIFRGPAQVTSVLFEGVNLEQLDEVAGSCFVPRICRVVVVCRINQISGELINGELQWIAESIALFDWRLESRSSLVNRSLSCQYLFSCSVTVI